MILSNTMDDFILIITVLLVHVFAWLTPGPNFVVIIRNSLVYSRKTGIWTALGFAFGNLTHIAYAIAGITLVISLSAFALSTLKMLGIGYLFYLGIKTLVMRIAPNEDELRKNGEDISSASAIKIGFFTNILSPKASLFFVSIFAGVLSTASSYWVAVFLAMALPINTFLIASLFAKFFTKKSVRSAYIKNQHIFNKVLGGALIALAALIAFT